MKTQTHKTKQLSGQGWISGKLLFLLSLFLITLIYACQDSQERDHEFQSDWPVLKHYDQDQVDRIALPLGGIGTGTVSLGGRGNLQDWEIMNRPAKGYNPGPPNYYNAPFFVLFIEAKGQKDTRLLEGPVPLYAFEGNRGVNKIKNHGMPRFEKSTFDAAYPLGQVNLHHSGSPVRVRIKGFNPLVPADVEKSGIPIAILEFELYNTTENEIDAAICYSMQNFIGDDGSFGVSMQNKNEYRESKDLRGIFLHSAGVDKEAEQWGTMAITTSSDENITYRTNWKKQRKGSSVLDFWDDFSEDGELDEQPSTGEDRPMASLATKVKLEPGEIKGIEFFITWHFPNRMAWSESMLKNYYAGSYTDAWDVAVKTLPDLRTLEETTVEFVDAFIGADLPEVVKEAALFNLSTLRTQTCFRTGDGYFYTWEGCNDDMGCCFGSCTHVWNYEHATGYLFGELARKKREIEFGPATSESGFMSFRVGLPLENAQQFNKAAADGQMGAIMKMYRDWQLSGDDKMLNTLYPNVKKALSFCWIPGGWDANKDGVMEGVQHNTMDVEYYGPNPQMGIWYLGALRAMEEMARHRGDEEFASNCHEIFQKGSKWIDENLFNGEYYVHKIQLPENMEEIHHGLVVGTLIDNPDNPDYQLGEGCLVDQLVGQYTSHITGLGYLVDPGHIKSTLNSIMKYNYEENMNDHYNCYRTFALGDEAALVMASYPYTRPENPFPYFTEVMTGFEYAAAVGMLYEGMEEEGLRCIRNIRDRYDGMKRNPFDEAECGHHYGRAMASWSALLALTGFHYSGVDNEITFDNISGKYFWSNGYAYGTVKLKDLEGAKQMELTVLNGRLQLASINIETLGILTLSEIKTLQTGETATFNIKPEVVK